MEIQKAFDTSWVEGTLVRLHEVGVRGQMWHLMCHFLRGTQSQARVDASLSAPWSDTGIAQGRVLSPLLFNLLVDSLATNVRQFAPGVRLAASPHRFSHQLYADDLVVVADCEHDLQVTCDVVAEWARKWRFTFGVGPTKSAVMVFGPGRTTVGCSVTLAGVPLPQVAEYPYLGVTLTTSLSWVPHVRKLISRGHRLFAQCVSWCSSERLPFQFASHLFLTYVLPSVSWGCEFCLGSAPAMRLLDGALRRWCRCLLGWPRRSPNAAVHVEVGWPDTQRLVTGRLLSLRAPQLLAHGRSFSPSCTGVPRHVCLSQLVECRLQCSLCFPADHHANPFRR